MITGSIILQIPAEEVHESSLLLGCTDHFSSSLSQARQKGPTLSTTLPPDSPPPVTHHSILVFFLRSLTKMSSVAYVIVLEGREGVLFPKLLWSGNRKEEKGERIGKFV